MGSLHVFRRALGAMNLIQVGTALRRRPRSATDGRWTRSHFGIADADGDGTPSLPRLGSGKAATRFSTLMGTLNSPEKYCHRPDLSYLLPAMQKTFAELNFPGRLIAVEGLDGSGKSTQIYLLKRWLELQNLKVFFSEWNSSQLVKSATSKGKKRELLTPTTFSLIHATDFADRYERQLLPLLRAGYLVLCDRYVFTAFARDTVRGCPPEWVRGIYSFAALPDLTFFFKANLEVSLARILEGRPELKYFEAGMDLRLSTDPYESFRIFQGRILEQYLAMSTEFNFLVIDANERVETQQQIVRQIVQSKIDLSQYLHQPQ